MDALALKLRNSRIISRAELVLFSPKRCWDTIAQETETRLSILKTTLFPWIVVGSICSSIGSYFFVEGSTIAGEALRMITSIIAGGSMAVLYLFFGAWLIQKVAPLFNGSASPQRAFSLLAHAQLPSIAGYVLSICPALTPLGILLFLASLHLLFQGTCKMTTVPASRRIFFCLLFIVAYLAISMLLGMAVVLPLFFLFFKVLAIQGA
jgi:hypothetical protein